nr:Siderophore biosynthesis non-ribosomal peptide synthetase modules [Kibdelosporangium sp. MJ126-NF4]
MPSTPATAVDTVDTRVERVDRRGRSVLDGLDEWIAKTPTATAVVCGEHAVSYRELDQRANQLAWALRARGAGPESVVALVLRRSVELAVAVVAVLRAGAAYLPLEPEYPDRRIASAIEDLGCVLVVADDPSADRWSTTDVPVIGPVAGGEPDHRPDVRTGGDNLQYIIYTSGSTGRPKGIAMTQGPQITLLDWCRMRYADQAVALQYYPITADVASLELLSTWWSGGCVVMATERDRYDIGAVARLIRRHGVTRVLLPVLAIHQLAAHAVRAFDDVQTLRELITTGDRQTVTPELRQMCQRLPDVFLDDHFGSTEVNVVVAPRLTAPAADWPDAPLLGRPIMDARVYVLDANLAPVPRNVVGDIYIGGGPLARGYAGRGALTAAAFVPDPFSGVPGARMYRTGDLGRWRSGGRLEFLGRADFQIKFRGYRVEPGEIESLLMARDDVDRAVVVVVHPEDASGEDLLTAYVVPASLGPGEVLHAETLRDELTSRLPAQTVPQAFVVVDAFPLTDTGKIDRRALPRPEHVEPEFVPPRDEVESAVAEVWAEVLGVDEVGIKHNFFWLGGHSLLVTRVMYELREMFGIEMSLALMFQRPTVESFAVEVRQAMARETA